MPSGPSQMVPSFPWRFLHYKTALRLLEKPGRPGRSQILRQGSRRTILCGAKSSVHSCPNDNPALPRRWGQIPLALRSGLEQGRRDEQWMGGQREGEGRITSGRRKWTMWPQPCDSALSASFGIDLIWAQKTYRSLRSDLTWSQFPTPSMWLAGYGTSCRLLKFLGLNFLI